MLSTSCFIGIGMTIQAKPPAESQIEKSWFAPSGPKSGQITPTTIAVKLSSAHESMSLGRKFSRSTFELVGVTH